MLGNEKTKPKYEEGQVYKTTDYSIFKYIDSNRVVNKHHVQELILSMERYPDLIPKNPILVNENMEIIDGQHRLQAASTLHSPIYFTIANNTTVETAQLMNRLQRSWQLMDFARSYAKNNDNPERAKVYKSFIALSEEFGTPTTTLIQFCEQATRHNATAAFREGNLKLVDIDTTRMWLGMAQEVEEKVDPLILRHSRSNFLGALFIIFRNSKYDHERMLRKLDEKHLTHQVTRMDYIRAFEASYNHNIKALENFVRFL
jgi:hypothetical protein